MKSRAYPRRSRKQSPHVTDGRIDTILPLGTMRDLLKAFDKDLCKKPGRLPDGISSCERAYFRFLFSLIVHAGIAGPDAWEEITSLRFSHITKVSDGFLAIPRKGGEIPVVLPPTVKTCAASLGLHLMRSRSPSHHVLSRYPLDGFIVPGRVDPTKKPDSHELTSIRNRFLLWLDTLAAPLRRRITFNQLCDLARIRLADQFQPIVSGTLLGLHLSNPIPVDQYSSVQKLADHPADFDDISIQGKEVKEFHPQLGIWKSNRGESPPNCRPVGTEWDRACAPLRKLVRPYTRADKRKARLLQPVIRSRLERFIRDGARRAGKTEFESWFVFTTRIPGKGTYSKWLRFNVLLLANWISSLIRDYPPNTVCVRFSDIIQIFRIMPGLLSGAMDSKSIVDGLIALRITASSLARLSDSLRGFSNHLHEKHGFKPLDLPWWLLRNRRELREQRIPTDGDITSLLAQFPTADPMDCVMRCGILLGRYFGLRLSELCQLRICDVWLKGKPTIFVWDSKGGGSRWIETGEIPQKVIDRLEGYHSRRLSESGINPAAPFLIQPNGRCITRAVFDRRIRKAMRRAELSSHDGKNSLATHGFRHTCANSLWLQNVPIVEVARRLGHKSLDTTIPHYIHSQPVKQFADMASQSGYTPVAKVSVSAMAALYGVTRRTVYHMKDSPPPAASNCGIPQACDFISLLHEFCIRGN